MNLLKYLIILSRKKLRQIFSVSFAISTNQMSIFPGFIDKFEKKFADFCGQDFSLSFCNGTSSIEASLFAIGLQPGDEVIVPSCTFHASIDPICNLGAQPIFADVDSQNFTICPEDIRKKISAKTKAIVVVHIFGIPANMQEIKKIAEEFKLDIIEDGSHAHGAIANGQICGSIGRIGAFSLHGGKAVAAGEGGIAVTRNKNDYLKMSLFGHFTLNQKEFSDIHLKEFEHTGLGHKRRIAPLSACLAKIDLDEILKTNEIMRQTSDRLDTAFSQIDGVLFPRLPKDSQKGGFFLGYAFSLSGCVVNVDFIVERFQSIGIQLTRYPFVMHHKLAIYNDVDFRKALLKFTLSGVGNRPTPSEKASGVILKNTEQLETNLLLIPRRYLITLSPSKIQKMTSILREEISKNS